MARIIRKKGDKEMAEITPALERLRDEIKENCKDRSGAIEDRLTTIETNHLPHIAADADSAKFRSGVAMKLCFLILAAILAAAIGIIVSS